MTHPIHRITGFDCVAPYSLHLRFEDGAETVVDLSDVLEGELCGPLRDPFVFSRVALDSEVELREVVAVDHDLRGSAVGAIHRQLHNPIIAQIAIDVQLCTGA